MLQSPSLLPSVFTLYLLLDTILSSKPIQENLQVTDCSSGHIVSPSSPQPSTITEHHRTTANHILFGWYNGYYSQLSTDRFGTKHFETRSLEKPLEEYTKQNIHTRTESTAIPLKLKFHGKTLNRGNKTEAYFVCSLLPLLSFLHESSFLH